MMRHLLFSLILVIILMPAKVEASTPQSKSQTIVYINGSKFYIHTTAEGETLSSIARLYGLSSDSLLKHNPHVKDGIKADQTLKIPVVTESSREVKPLDSRAERRLKKEFVFYNVRKGETLYSISRKYGISVDRILEDNPDVDPLNLKIGERLLIRKSAIGQSDDDEIEEQIEDYATALNSVSGEQEYIYYVVQPKETIYSLSRRFGMTEQEFIELNNLQDGLKAGAIVKVLAPSGTSVEVEGEDIVTSEGEVVVEIQDSISLIDTPKYEVVFSAASQLRPLNVAMLLPLSQKGVSNLNFAAFYNGFLLGLEELKGEGISTELMLYNTNRDSTTIAEIITKEPFRNSDLIVGPVYSDEMALVIDYAERESKPVVTPLASMPDVSSDALFQMAPTQEHKYDKIEELIADKSTIVTLIRTNNNDQEFENEIIRELMKRGIPYTYYDYVSVQGVENAEKSDLTPLLNNKNKQLFIVLPNNEVDVDRILASLASAQTNLIARSQSVASFKVIGSSRWNRYHNIDRTTFFKNSVVLFAIFHAKRDSEIIKNFDTRYIRAFSQMPTLYSYRGYETAMVFVKGMFSDIEYDMEGRRYKPLQTTYTFKQDGDSKSRVNVEWVRISYNPDFTITID